MRPHKNSLLHAHQNEPENPFLLLAEMAVLGGDQQGARGREDGSGRMAGTRLHRHVTAEDGRTVVEGLLG